MLGWDPPGQSMSLSPASAPNVIHPSSPCLRACDLLPPASAPAQSPPPRAHGPPGQKHSQGPHCSPRHAGLRAARAGPQCSRVPPTLAPAFPLHKWRRPRHGSEAEKATTGAGTGRLPPACPGKGPAGPEKGQLPTRAGQVPAVPELARTEQTAAAAPGPDCADGGPSSRSRVRRVLQAEPSSHPRARRFRAFILEKVKACRYSNKIYKK